MGKLFEKSIVDGKKTDKSSFLKDFMSSMHVMTSDELSSNRNSTYQYLI